MKKFLHPNLFPDHGCTLHQTHTGGSFNFFGINFDVKWSVEDECWVFESTSFVSTEEAADALKQFYEILNSVSPSLANACFSDESNISVADLLSKSKPSENHRLIIYDDNGTPWLLTYESDHLQKVVGLRMREGKITSKVRLFEPDETVTFSNDWCVDD